MRGRMVCTNWVLSDPRGLGMSANGFVLQDLGPKISSGWTSSRVYLSLFARPRLAWSTRSFGKSEQHTGV